MRIGLRWRVAGSFALLIILTTLGLYLYVRHAGSTAMRDQLRERLGAGCDVVRSAIEAVPRREYQPRVMQLGRRLGARVTVIARDGKVLADSQADPTRMVLHDTRIEVVEALEKGVAVSERPSATLHMPMMYVAKAGRGAEPIVRLAMPLEDVHRASFGLGRTILLTAITAALIAILAGIWIAGGVTRSFSELALAARRFAAGDLQARARVRADDEAADVAEALNSMAENLTAMRARMRENARHLRSILTQMADGILAVDVAENVLILNPAAGALLDLDPAAAVGESLATVVLNYELQDAVRRALRLRTLVEQRIEAGDDRRRFLAIAVSPVEDEEGGPAGAVAAIRDITHIERLQSVRQDFVANAGHELRTPVAAIRSMSETLQRGALNDPEAGPEFLAGIVENTERLENLINDMMELARLEAVAGDEDAGAVRVSELIPRVAGRLAPQAQSKQLAVKVSVDPQVRNCVIGQSMDAALTNLLDNAIKYTPTGGHVELAAQAVDQSVRITVTDTGPGIPEAKRERIFERFYRLDRARSRALGGTGLGLSIVKHSVEALGGRVWVEQPADGGARFVVQVSLVEPQ